MAAAPHPAARTLAPAARIRWDRVGRVGMLVALALLLYLAISPLRSLIADFHLSAQRQAQLRALRHQAATLAAEQHALAQPGTPQVEARNLGLVKPGERAYIVYGLPND